MLSVKNLMELNQEYKEEEENLNNILKCPICHKKFKRKPSFYGHLQSHNFKSGEIRFKCPREQCNELFDNLAQFWKHERIHKQKNRPFICKVCSNSYERYTFSHK